MKKLIGLILVILVGCTLLASCGQTLPDSGDQGQLPSEEQIRVVYASYVEYSKDKGETPKSYEDWLAEIKGNDGANGANGLTPFIGENGNWWIGDTDTGVDANGIKGEKGDKGDTGADGVGIAKIEKTATNGNVDTYTITLTNGKTYTFTVTNGKDGANGMDGENGKDGADGKDGLTPFIGENGNWWIGDTDTGVKAVAEQTAQKGTDTITVVSIVVASVALLSNLALVVWIVTKKKKILV